MALSQTNLCNKRPFPVKSVPYEHAQWSAAINALIIVASLSDSLCSASVRQRGKGVSERSELAPCWGEPERAPHRRVERSQSIYIYIYMVVVRPSPARRYIHCTATRDIFRRPHEETSTLSGTTCTIIAESAK